jgi:hypothetical protein
LIEKVLFQGKQEGEIMKKIFLAYIVLSVLVLTAMPIQALIGIEDDVPGYDVLVPFFFVSMPGHGHDNTLIVITEVCRSPVTFLYGICDARSVLQGNGSMGTTRCGVISTDALTLINQMSPVGREALSIDTDGDGVKDHYCGYMVLQNADAVTPENQVVAMVYQVNLPSGMAATVNIPARELDESGLITDAKLVDPVRRTEYFSANALFRAQQYIAQEAVIDDAQYARLMPRYFIQDEKGKTYWFIWTNQPGPLLHINWFDEEENSFSGNLSLAYELNIIDLAVNLPAGLHATFPKGGWADIATPSIGGGGFDGDREWVAYTLQMAFGPAQRSYAVLTHVHKEAGQGSPP